MSDTRSTRAITRALYECLSGSAGQSRDWIRFRSLFFPGARLMRTSLNSDGTSCAQAMDVTAYEADTAGTFRHESFYEAEIAHRADRFGNIAHVFSVYEARRAAGDAVPFKRGINSIQLYWDGRRWWIVSVLWDSERDDNPIPDEYLGTARQA